MLEWLPFPSSGDLPDPGIEPTSPVFLALQADSLPAEPSGKPIKEMTSTEFDKLRQVGPPGIKIMHVIKVVEH